MAEAEQPEASHLILGLPSKKCTLCSFESPTIPLLLSHLRSVHASDSRFHVTCGIGGCCVTASSFSALYSHIYRNHPDVGVVKRNERVFASLESEPQQLPMSVSVSGVSSGEVEPEPTESDHVDGTYI